MTTARVDASDGLVYESRPEGAPTLLFVHGLGDSRQTWSEAFEDEAVADYALCAVDLPGFGDSPAVRPFTFEDCVARLTRLVESALRPPIVVVGHSLGGAVATLLAERCDGIRGLVLVEANLTTAPPDSIAATAARARRADAFPQWFADFRRAVETAGADESMRRYLASLDRADVDSFAEASSELFEYAQADGNGRRYLRLRLPRLYVAGGGVLPVTFEFLERHALDVLRFPDAGHAVMVDEAPAFYAALDEWIVAHVRPDG